MRRLLRLMLCVAVLACASVATTVSSAQATQCPSGRFCVWADNGYVTSGSPYNYFGYLNWSVDYSAHNFLNTSINVNDRTSSYHNNGNTNYARVYKDSYYNGQFSGPKAPGTAVGDMVSDWNDTLSSGCFIFGTSGGCIGP